MNASNARNLLVALVAGATLLASSGASADDRDRYRTVAQERGDREPERWQAMSEEDRRRALEQRRPARQLSPEERRQLRRDVLEASRDSRSPRDERRR